jgi:type IV secretory pathway VirB4 component
MSSPKATQDFVPIKEVRDGVLILKDNSLRSILIASSLNFSLKSEEERNAILYQFQDFLNSLDFPVQIYIQSRRLDIRPYLALLEERRKEQINDLMKIQTEEYITFIKKFTDDNNIMTKSFFIVISYDPAVIQGGALKLNKLLNRGEKESDIKQKMQNFEENRTQLEQRIGAVEQGLMRCGVRTIKLGTEEVIELFYKIFNPGETEKPIKLS